MDYYTILGVNSNAGTQEIKSAFKRLAILYHPDKNPGSIEAEEKFKAINEAYQILSDPIKRSRYDRRFEPEVTPNSGYTSDNRRRQTRRPVYRDQQYKFDKEYFRIQGLSFVVFFILAAFSFGIITGLRNYQEQKRQAIYSSNTKRLELAFGHFHKEEFHEAFQVLNKASAERILDIRFLNAADSLLGVIRKKADSAYKKESYQLSLNYTNLVLEFENPQQFDTRLKKVYCYLGLKEYPRAVDLLETMLLKYPDDLELQLILADVYFSELKNYVQALKYYTIAKNAFKESYSEQYGVAFELMIDPAIVPEAYYQMFLHRAQTLAKLGNTTESIKDYNWTFYLRPERSQNLEERGLQYLKEGNLEHACSDFQLAMERKSTRAKWLIKRYCNS